MSAAVRAVTGKLLIRVLIFMIVTVSGLPLRVLASTGLGLESEVGVLQGLLSRRDVKPVEGLLIGLALGYRKGPLFGGVEIQGRYFEISFEGESLHLTNVPIGLVGRWRFSKNWRASISWHWDDVLYNDFRFKWQSGFKIPKDYDIAYEGPGSWKFGISRKVSEHWDLSLTYSRQSYARFKRRRPIEMIGDVVPSISIETINLSAHHYVF